MVTAWRYIRLCDRDNSDFAMNAAEGFQLLQDLKALLLDGGVFRETAGALLTNKALHAIRGRTVLLGRGAGTETAISMSWPSPESDVLTQPAKLAQQCPHEVSLSLQIRVCQLTR